MTDLTRPERDELVGGILDLRERLEKAQWETIDKGAPNIVDLRSELAGVHERYAESLPSVVVSRCPFSGRLLETSLDSWGLDGPFWDAEWPIRRRIESPRSLLVLSGSMALGEPVETTPHLVLPGPQVPCVDPVMLRRPGVAAVLSSLPVGVHTSYPVAYFSDPPADEPPTLNTWGTRCWTPGWGGVAVDLEIVEDEEGLDSDLTPWIKGGKLFWIRPGDRMMRLHATVAGCPYLGLRGSATPSRILDGRLQDESGRSR